MVLVPVSRCRCGPSGDAAQGLRDHTPHRRAACRAARRDGGRLRVLGEEPPVHRSGSGGEERFTLAKEVSSIGRDEDCDVILPDTSVSRRHALIYRVDERLYRVEDHNSSNGTRVNRETVVTEFLRDGDILEIGAYQLTFVNPQAVERPAARPARS